MRESGGALDAGGDVGVDADVGVDVEVCVEAVVVMGGAFADQAVPAVTGALVICADSGVDHARAWGLGVDLVIGDMDSVSADGLAWAEEQGADVDRHEPDKDQTDLELALQAAQRLSAGGHVLVLGGAGGRLDHELANLALLTSPRWSDLELTAWIGTARVDVVRRHRSLIGVPGGVVSLLAWHGDATGVTTDRLKWGLAGATVRAGSAIGTSNEYEADRASVAVDRGVLTAITPNAPVVEHHLHIVPRSRP